MPPSSSALRHPQIAVAAENPALQPIVESEEDVYNPAAFDVMIKDWTRAKDAAGG